MSSELRKGTFNQLLLPALSAFSLLGHSALAQAQTTDLPRCYDTPQLYKKVPESSKSKTIHLHVKGKPGNQRVVEDPGPFDPPVDELVENATVKIERLKSDQSYSPLGSGFVATAPPSSESAIVTAGHVVFTSALSSLRITSRQGLQYTVQSGCYMYEKYGKFAPRSTLEETNIDVAVLKLSQPIGQTALRVSAVGPRRGEWVHLNDYQRGRTIDQPAKYTGVVVNSQRQSDSSILTGLGPTKTHMKRGSSGGPVMDGRGIVKGFSVSAWDFKWNFKTFIEQFNFKIHGASRLESKQGYIQHPSFIKTALASPRY